MNIVVALIPVDCTQKDGAGGAGHTACDAGEGGLMRRKTFEIAVPFEIIYWEDHWSDGSTTWKDTKDVPLNDPLVIATIGFLVKEDKWEVILAPDYRRTENRDVVRESFHILKRAIVKRVRLELPYQIRTAPQNAR